MGSSRSAAAATALNPSQSNTWPWLAAGGGLVLVGLLIVCIGGMGFALVPILTRLGFLLWVLIEQSLLVLPWLAAAMGYGWGVRQLLARRHIPWSAGLSGQIILGAGLFCLLGWLVALISTHVLTAWAVGIAGWALLVWQIHITDSSRWARPRNWDLPAWPALLAAIAIGLLVGATTLAPLTLWADLDNGYLALLHHLQVPREWAHNGRMTGLEHNVYSYLPNLFEVAFLQIALWRGDFYPAAYGAQLLHACMAVLVACQIARTVVRLSGSNLAATVAGAAYLAAPWTLMAGALAFPDHAAAALAALSLNLLLPDPAGGSAPAPKAPFILGLLAGAAAGLAVLCRVESAALVVLPLILAALIPHQARLPRVAGLLIAVALAVSPWLIRNGMWVSNPLFPYFGESLGSAHWTAEQARRWSLAHSAGDTGPLAALTSIFTDSRLGFTFIPLALIAIPLLLKRRPALTNPTLMLALVLALQLLTWAFVLPADTRLLMPALIPAVMLVGLGLHAASDLPYGQLAAAVIAVVVLFVGTLLQSLLYINQLGGEAPRNIEAIEELTRMEPASVGRQTSIFHLVNIDFKQQFGPDARIYTEGVSAPFYFDDVDGFDYHSPWDASPIGPVLRARGGPGARAWLEQNGYVMVIVDTYWISRHFSRTFARDPSVPGYDTTIDLQSLQALDSALQTLSRSERQMVYRVPQRR